MQLWVGRQLPGELRLPGLQGVVQHHALTIDVVIEKLVVRQARAIGRDDVDDGHAALGLQLRCTARPVDHDDTSGQRSWQVTQEQAGDGPAQFALR